MATKESAAAKSMAMPQLLLDASTGFGNIGKKPEGIDSERIVDRCSGIRIEVVDCLC